MAVEEGALNDAFECFLDVALLFPDQLDEQRGLQFLANEPLNERLLLVRLDELQDVLFGFEEEGDSADFEVEDVQFGSEAQGLKVEEQLLDCRVADLQLLRDGGTDISAQLLLNEFLDKTHQFKLIIRLPLALPPSCQYH